MSRRKIVSYVRPEEPKFLRELKEKIKYKAGPTISTKKEALPRVSDDAAEEETNEEKPLVVVLNPGDLTAEEAESYKQQKQQEEEDEGPMDLSVRRVIFNKDKVKKKNSNPVEGPANKKTKKSKRKKAVLSFDDEDDENLA